MPGVARRFFALFAQCRRMSRLARLKRSPTQITVLRQLILPRVHSYSRPRLATACPAFRTDTATKTDGCRDCHGCNRDDDGRSCGRLRLPHLLQELQIELLVKSQHLLRGRLHHMSGQYQRDNGSSTSGFRSRLKPRMRSSRAAAAVAIAAGGAVSATFAAAFAVFAALVRDPGSSHMLLLCPSCCCSRRQLMTEAPGRVHAQMQVRLHCCMWHLLSRRSLL